MPQREIQAQRPLSEQREVPAQQPSSSYHQDGRQREVQAQQPFSGQGVLTAEQPPSNRLQDRSEWRWYFDRGLYHKAHRTKEIIAKASV